MSKNMQKVNNRKQINNRVNNRVCFNEVMINFNENENDNEKKITSKRHK